MKTLLEYIYYYNGEIIFFVHRTIKIGFFDMRTLSEKL